MLLSWICFAIHCSPSPYPTCFTKLDITNLQGRIVDCSVEFTCNIQHFVSCKCTSKSIVNHYSLTQNNFISIILISFWPLHCLSFWLPFCMLKYVLMNATFNNMSAISWRTNLLVEETGVSGKISDLTKTNFITT
jgi:hypothetical protein